MCEVVQPIATHSCDNLEEITSLSAARTCRASSGRIDSLGTSQTQLKDFQITDLNQIVQATKQAGIQRADVHLGDVQDYNPQVVFQITLLSIFSLYHMLTKQQIISDSQSLAVNKEEITVLNDEISRVFKKHQEERKIALEKEKNVNRWDDASSFFSWFGSLMSVIMGVILIATGVSAIAGAILLAGGLIQSTSQMLQLTGTWEKIKNTLPGQDERQKKAVIMWMQISIAVLALVLAGVGAIIGGFSTVSGTLSTAQYMIGGVAAIGSGVVAIGMGVASQEYESRKAEIELHKKKLAELRFMREDCMSFSESQVEIYEKLLEGFKHVLDYLEKIFQADQMVNRRG